MVLNWPCWFVAISDDQILAAAADLNELEGVVPATLSQIRELSCDRALALAWRVLPKDCPGNNFMVVFTASPPSLLGGRVVQNHRFHRASGLLI
jgi:hypothetical protein